MAGLFEQYDNPMFAGNLAMGAGLLEAAGPQFRPVSFGQALGRGIASGQRAAQDAASERRRNDQHEAHMVTSEMELLMNKHRYQQMRRAAEAPPAPQFEKVGDALLRIGPDGSATPVYQGQQKPAEPSPIGKLIAEMDKFPPGHPMWQIYRDAITKASTHQPPVSIANYGSPVAGIGPDGQPQFFQFGNKGGPPMPTGVRPPPQAADAKPMTDTQANASLYSTRMEAADRIINDLEGRYNRTWLAGRQMAGEGALGMIVNSSLPAEAQRADQAQRDFVNAVLRRESGAVISPTEFANAKQQYFPQPGDTIEVVRQKAQNRRTAIEGIRAAAGAKAPVNRDSGSKTLRFDVNGRRID